MVKTKKKELQKPGLRPSQKAKAGFYPWLTQICLKVKLPSATTSATAQFIIL